MSLTMGGFLAILVAMIAMGFLVVGLIGYLMDLYVHHRARKNADGQPSDAPLPSP